MNDTDVASILEQCLKDGGAANWELFIRHAQPVVASAVLRALSHGPSTNRDLADDLTQDCFLKICANEYRILRNFRGHDSVALRAYLRTIAASVVMDHFRRSHAMPTVDLEGVASALASHDTTAENLDRDKLLFCVENCLRSQDDRSRRIFWLYHRQGLTPRSISALPGIGMATGGVETAVYRLTAAVRNCLRKAGVLDPAIFREGSRA